MADKWTITLTLRGPMGESYHRAIDLPDGVAGEDSRVGAGGNRNKKGSQIQRQIERSIDPHGLLHW